MTVRILIGDVFDRLADLPADSVDCVVTSPPYWGLRDYGVAGQLGMEPTLGEHLDVMVRVFDAVRRVMKPEGTLWLNYGDCYATKPNGRSAADTKAAGTDDRTFRDKPFSTVGPIIEQWPETRMAGRRGRSGNLGNGGIQGKDMPGGRVVAGGLLKPKDLCMVPNRLAIALQDAGWWVRSEIVWGKPNPMPDSSGRYRPSTAHEKLFLLTKSATSFYDSEAVRMPAERDAAGVWPSGGPLHIGESRKTPLPKTKRGHVRAHQGMVGRWDGMSRAEQMANGRLLRNYEPDLVASLEKAERQHPRFSVAEIMVWEIATAAFSEAHFATFPPALVAPCIMAGCPAGGLVLDPFGGAGTTGLVADRLQRDAILIELNPDYAELARRRIEGDGGMFTDVAA